jgi:hypothetical protein
VIEIANFPTRNQLAHSGQDAFAADYQDIGESFCNKKGVQTS